MSRSIRPTTRRSSPLPRRSAIDFVVIGPDAPVVAGLGDDVRAAGIACFGPSKAAAQLEGSKGFTKALCDEMGIPTARLSAGSTPRPLPSPMCAGTARRSSSRPTGWRSARA